MQLRLWQRIKQMLQDGTPVRLILLKGRQMGSSTFFVALAYWLIVLRPNRNAIIAAHDEDSASNLYSKIQLFYQLHPPQMRPNDKINNREMLYLANDRNHDQDDPGLHSRIVVALAKNTRMGRSFSIHYALCSEFAFWPEPKEALVAVRNAMPKRPGTFLILECTANGQNYFHQLWNDEERDYDKIFVCWVASDEYRKEIDPEDYPVLYDYDHEFYGNEAEEAVFIREELKSWYPEEAASKEWLDHEVMCRLAWRRETIVSECEKDLDHFRREYPTTPEQAFLGSGQSVFGAANNRKLSERRQYLIDNPPMMKRYRFDAKSGTFYESPFGPLKCFEPAIKGAQYAIGVDASLGVEGGDPTAIGVFRMPEMVQAAVFNAVISPDEAAALIYYLGKHYNNAIVGIEANEEGGWGIIAILSKSKQYYYRNLYQRDKDESMFKGDKAARYGWSTNKATKSIMLTDMRNAITDDIITWKDTDTLSQLISYQLLPTGKTGCPYPMHDDLVSAHCIAYQMAVRGYKQVRSRERYEPPPKSLDWWLAKAERMEQKSAWENRFGRN